MEGSGWDADRKVVKIVKIVKGVKVVKVVKVEVRSEQGWEGDAGGRLAVVSVRF